MFFKKKKKKKIDDLLSFINKEREEVLSFIKSNGNKKMYYYDGACNTKGFFTWEKDAEGRYLFANDRHCTDFFKLDQSCVHEVMHKHDIDLINAYIEKTGNRHTFLDCCEMTDVIMKKTQKQSRFIEIGYIDNDLVLLDVTKTPVFDDNGDYKGTTAVAIDISQHAAQTEQLINTCLKNGTVKNIYITADSAVYQFIPKNESAFLKGFPK